MSIHPDFPPSDISQFLTNLEEIQKIPEEELPAAVITREGGTLSVQRRQESSSKTEQSKKNPSLWKRLLPVFLASPSPKSLHQSRLLQSLLAEWQVDHAPLPEKVLRAIHKKNTNLHKVQQELREELVLQESLSVFQTELSKCQSEEEVKALLQDYQEEVGKKSPFLEKAKMLAESKKEKLPLSHKIQTTTEILLEEVQQAQNREDIAKAYTNMAERLHQALPNKQAVKIFQAIKKRFAPIENTRLSALGPLKNKEYLYALAKAKNPNQAKEAFQNFKDAIEELYGEEYGELYREQAWLNSAKEKLKEKLSSLEGNIDAPLDPLLKEMEEELQNLKNIMQGARSSSLSSTEEWQVLEKEIEGILD